MNPYGHRLPLNEYGDDRERTRYINIYIHIYNPQRLCRISQTLNNGRAAGASYEAPAAFSIKMILYLLLNGYVRNINIAYLTINVNYYFSHKKILDLIVLICQDLVAILVSIC